MRAWGVWSTVRGLSSSNLQKLCTPAAGPSLKGEGSTKNLKKDQKTFTEDQRNLKRINKIFTTYKAICCFSGWFLGFLAFRLPSLVASRLPSLSASRLLGFPASRLLGFAASRLRGFSASWLLGFLVTCVLSLGLVSFLASRISGFCPSSLLGFLASRLSWLLGNMCVLLLL